MTPSYNGSGKVVQSKDAISRILHGETVLLTPENSKVHVLDEVGGRIWELCATPRTIDELADLITDEYEVERDRARRDIEDFISELADLKVISRE